MRSALRLLFIILFLVIHSAFVLFWVVTGGLFYVQRVYGPSLKFVWPNGADGKNNMEVCSKASTDTLEDLLLSKTLSEAEAKHVVQTHGAAVIQSVLTRETAQAFRDYIMKANHELEQTYVHNAWNRYHIMPPPTEPTVQKAFKEVAEHPQLKPLIDGLLGPGATLASFSVITNEFGAIDQHWHADTWTSSAGYPESFVPEYTLAVALQDISEEMGATAITPGTHECNPQYDWDTSVRATLKQGDAFLYSSDVMHRGMGHTDPNAEERVLAFITFAGSRQGPDDTRWLPPDTVHALNWRMWGHTIDDFTTMKERPWRLWHTVGLFNGKRTVKPWNLLHDFLVIYVGEEGTVSHTISENFTKEDFENFVWDMKFVYGLFGTMVYIAIVIPMLFLWGSMSKDQKISSASRNPITNASAKKRV